MSPVKRGEGASYWCGHVLSVQPHYHIWETLRAAPGHHTKWLPIRTSRTISLQMHMCIRLVSIWCWRCQGSTHDNTCVLDAPCPASRAHALLVRYSFSLGYSYMCMSILGECSTLWGERERGTVHGGRIRLLPPEINWAHRMLSQSSASSLLCWSCTHWLKCIVSVISDVPLMGSHIEGGESGFN